MPRLDALRETGRSDKAGSRESRPWGRWLLLGWLAQVAIRLWLSRDQTIPVATPDETGYLFAARVLAGGPDADISYSTVYRGGYALLLVPAYWVTEDPATVYRLAIIGNALAGAILLPLAYALLRRLSFTPGWSYGLAHVTALLPAGVFYTQFVLTDAVLPVVLLGWLLLLHAWLCGEGPPARIGWYGVAASLLAAYASTMHSRGIVVLAVQLGLLLFAGARRWRPWRPVLLAGALAAVVTALGMLINLWVVPHLYPFGSYDMNGMLVSRLTGLDGFRWTLPVGAGQLWYLTVSTAGVAGLGLAAVTGAALGRGTPARLRAVAAALLVTVLGIAFATAAALPDESRVGNHAYGRYLACLAPVLFVVGLAVLLRARLRAVLACAGAVSALVVAIAAIIQVNAADKFGGYLFVTFDFPETGFLTWHWTQLRLWVATLAGLAVLWLVVAAARLPRHGRPVVAGLLAAGFLAANVAIVAQVSRPLDRQIAGAADLTGVVEPGARPIVAIDQNVRWQIRLPQMHQIWWRETVNFDSRYNRPPEWANIVILYWHKGYPAESSWRDVPAGWRVVDSRRTLVGDWVAWGRA
jgi:hypothetical protein